MNCLLKNSHSLFQKTSSSMEGQIVHCRVVFGGDNNIDFDEYQFFQVVAPGKMKRIKHEEGAEEPLDPKTHRMFGKQKRLSPLPNSTYGHPIRFRHEEVKGKTILWATINRRKNMTLDLYDATKPLYTIASDRRL